MHPPPTRQPIQLLLLAVNQYEKQCADCTLCQTMRLLTLAYPDAYPISLHTLYLGAYPIPLHTPMHTLHLCIAYPRPGEPIGLLVAKHSGCMHPYMHQRNHSCLASPPPQPAHTSFQLATYNRDFQLGQPLDNKRTWKNIFTI